MGRTARRIAAAYALLGALSFTVTAIVASLTTGPGGANAAAAERTSTRAQDDGGGFVGDRESARSVRLAWVGDTMFGTATAAPPGDGDALFAGVRSVLRSPDLTLGNLEGVLATTGASKCGAAPGPNCFAFRAAPRYAGALRRAGFDAMTLANNHALDYGEGARGETIAALTAARIAHTGLPGQVTVVRRNGVRIALLGFAPYRWAASLTDIGAAQRLVQQAGREADLVVVTIHAGAEGAGATRVPAGPESAYGEARGDARAFSHAVIDAGADLVLGSGPHVVRGMETYNQRLIAYSLGDFAGWHNFGLGGALSQSGILEVRLAASGKLLSGRWRSVELQAPGVPKLQASHAVAATVAGLSKADFGARGVRLDARGRF